MKVGDLVKAKATWCNNVGIIFKRAKPDDWWVLWTDGERGFHSESDLEVLCKQVIQ